MSEPQNPPAFPSHFGDPEMNDPRNRISCGGMTLRDYFAGQALAGLMANADIPFAPDYAECEPEQIATASFDFADAMLRARTKGGAG